MRKMRILLAPQLVQIAERDQADEGPHPAGDVKHQRVDAGPKIHDQTGGAPSDQHDDGTRQQITHDSSLVAGHHDAARLWLVLGKLQRFDECVHAKRVCSPGRMPTRGLYWSWSLTQNAGFVRSATWRST